MIDELESDTSSLNNSTNPLSNLSCVSVELHVEPTNHQSVSHISNDSVPPLPETETYAGEETIPKELPVWDELDLRSDNDNEKSKSVNDECSKSPKKKSNKSKSKSKDRDKGIKSASSESRASRALFNKKKEKNKKDK